MPLIVNGVSCWFRSKRKRRGLVYPRLSQGHGGGRESGHPKEFSKSGQGEEVRWRFSESIMGVCPLVRS